MRRDQGGPPQNGWGAAFSKQLPQTNRISSQHRTNTGFAQEAGSVRRGELPPPLATAQQARSATLSNRAADIARGEAIRDAKRALKAICPEERDELRTNAKLLTSWAKHLTTGAPHGR